MPLPKEDTTPPVTNTKRVIVLLGFFRRGDQCRGGINDGRTGYHNPRPAAHLLAPPTESAACVRLGSGGRALLGVLDRFVQRQVRRGEEFVASENQRYAPTLRDRY